MKKKKKRKLHSCMYVLKQCLLIENYCWQVIFCGILLVLMAVGNFANTVQTLMVKSRFKAKMKRSKSKQELQ